MSTQKITNTEAWVAARVYTLRKARGYSQRELARRMGCDHGQISRIENGYQGISFTQIESFAKALEVTPDHLLASPAMIWKEQAEIQVNELLAQRLQTFREGLTTILSALSALKDWADNLEEGHG